jgi:hypothetical protein
MTHISKFKAKSKPVSKGTKHTLRAVVETGLWATSNTNIWLGQLRLGSQIIYFLCIASFRLMILRLILLCLIGAAAMQVAVLGV